MSYHALYRKYRSSTLKDIIGQDVVVQILQNAMKNNKICHAYMFSGPRGIGKTSIAKLIAKAVNCENLQDGDACGKCNNCKSINEGFCPDIIEIDAASNNGVEEIREIRNKVSLVPNQLKYKVYIIDEVHMLSIGAFNALLKTLEEPPEHIIFILATTDLHKVPSTIISRCQCLEFKRISTPDIVKRLRYISDCEQIEVDNDVLEYIAELSDGGLRDAIGMLDKLNAYSNAHVSMEDFEKVNGIVSNDMKKQFLNYIVDENVAEIIKFIDDIYNKGKDLIIFTQDLLQMCKKQYINYYIQNHSDFDVDFLLDFSKVLNDLLKDLKNTANVKTSFEISLLSFLGHKRVQKEVEIIDNNSQKKPKKEVEKPKIISREIISTEKVQVFDKNINDLIINNCFARADKKEKQFFESKWDKLNDYALDSELGAAACYVSDGKICAVGEGEIILSFAYESLLNRGYPLIPKIKKVFEKIYDKTYDVALITDEEWQKEKEKFIQNMNNHVPYTYQPLDGAVDKIKKEKMKENINDDSVTSQAIELFGEEMVSSN